MARALVREPKVLLLDEPLSALDAKLRESMRVELKHLHDRLGLTFILVTHDQTEALVMSDRIVVMNAGRIEQEGSPAALYDRPASPYVANFLGASSLLTGQVASAEAGSLTVEFGGSSLAAVAQGYRVSDAVMICIRPEKASLHAAQPSDLAEDNLLHCEVREHLFHGDAVRVQLASGSASFFVDVQLQGGHGPGQDPAAG